MTKWRDLTLGDVVTLQRGFDLPGRLRTPGPFPVVSSSGVTGTHDEFKVTPPGVVIGRYGSLGEVHWIEEPFWPLNTSLWVKDFKGNDPRFVSYLLKTVTMDGSSASAVPGVNRNHLHALHVRIPPLGAQQQIAVLLSNFDQLIDIGERRIQYLEDFARSLYHEWIIRTRSVGDGLEHHGATVGIPRGWCAKQLGDITDVNRHTVKAGQLPDPLEYLDIASLEIRRRGRSKVVSAMDAPGRARRRVADGDVVWATVRPNRSAHCLIHDPPQNLIASTGLAVLTPVSVPSSFLFEYASSQEFRDFLVGRATGSAYPAVRPGDFRSAPVVVPPVSLLERFATAADPALRLTSALRRQCDQQADVRDLLLPRLITGQLDISDVDLGALTPTEVA